MRVLNTLVLFALAFALVSCDSNDDDDNGGNLLPGTFQVSVTGSFDDSFSAAAVFAMGVDEESGEEYFVIQMVSGSGQTGKVVYAVTSGGRPPTGQYPFLDAEDFEGEELPVGAYLGLVSAPTGEDAYVIWSMGGSMNVTTSTNSRFGGTFEFPAGGFTFGGQTEPLLDFSVQGQFDAVFSNVPITIPDL